ncbi:hypothetical protein GCM10011392_27750 [Wenxinia marina]|uniref:RND family efflux transporter, MFP subunit n=2 Tax=Wenxinia TaxID=653686 RepID=A0A0D0Q428_9RHOB|nr:RND family efflux transporter, MFP subunit [Wenxinia marina DSM 24838]GGL71591.1 hypothetical protein GCM10011392_27750 [Wenxinia marina]
MSTRTDGAVDPPAAPTPANGINAEASAGFADDENWIAGLRSRLTAEVAVLAMGPVNTGPYMLSALSPPDATPGEGLSAALDHAVAQRKPIVKSGFLDRGVTSCAIGVPILLDGALHGVVAVQLPVRADLDLRRVVDEISWALPGVQFGVLMRQMAEGELSQARARSVVELLAATLDEPRWTVAAATAVTDLANRLGCDRVALGVRRRLRSKVVALSHSGGFSRKSELMQRIADAMDEAIDQGGPILLPDDAADRLTLTAAHDALGDQGAPRAILTAPLRRDGRVTGALTFERTAANPFRPDEVDLIQAVAGVLGPVLEEKRLNDRPLPVKAAQSVGNGLAWTMGPRNAGLKATFVLLALAGVLAWNTTVPFRITADARVEGAIRRVVAAPLDGYVSAAAAIAGDIVREGDMLAQLDDRDLRLELARWETVRAQRQREYETALAERDRAAIGIAATQIEQAEAEIALLNERIARTQIRAPFDGIVLSGDLDQSVGAPVARGEVLYEIAPLDAYRIVLSVDERDLALVEPELRGEVVLSALPGREFAIETGRVTSVAGVEDGRNVFRVDAELAEPTDLLRPGMAGVAKIGIGERPFPVVWTRGVVDWLRLTLWRWAP